jgi:hypothetical protein
MCPEPELVVQGTRGFVVTLDVQHRVGDALFAQPVEPGNGEEPAEPARLSHFLTLTGLEPGDIRALAQAPWFLASVLEHLANDESLLLTFAANASVAPETISPALALLQRSLGKAGLPLPALM